MKEDCHEAVVGGRDAPATFIPSGIAFTGFHAVAPAFVAAAFVLLVFETRSLGVSIRERFFFKRISTRLWLIAGAVMVAAVALSFAAKPLILPFMRLCGLPVPAYTPFFLNPSVVVSPAMVLKGNYGLLVLQVVTLLLNLSAEELYVRAWMPPKLSRYGKVSRVVNGVLFFPQLLVASLGMALAVCLTRSIWPALVGHRVGNFLLGVHGFLTLVF